jgi:putative oxidoreductase
MNWYGTQKGEGYEFHLLVIAMAIYLVIEGAGAVSVDHMLSAASQH